MRIDQVITAIITTAGFCSATAAEPGEAPSGDKSQYNLFNPTPRALMRELSPDRPDATESPMTVDAGHFAMEVSLFDWRRDGRDDTYTLMSSNLKLGLTNTTDLQLLFDSYAWENPASGDGAEGFGDIQLRLKYNLWGNDGDDTALALFPFAKIPTGTALSNDEWEGGLIVPFSIQLSDRVGLGLMAEFDVVYNDGSRGHEFEFLHSAVVGIELTERLGTFIEYIGITGDAPYQAYCAGGFTFTVNDDLVLDCGAQVGLNGGADDLGVFAGFTERF